MTTTTSTATQASPLQMLRAEVSLPEFRRWMGGKRLQDTDHAMHCLLTECFGDLAPKPFRLIMPRGGSSGCLYGYGAGDAEALREAMSVYACPLQSQVMPPAKLESKVMPSEWQTGRRIGFEARIRPVVRILRDSARSAPDRVRTFQEGRARPGHEWDAFLWEAIVHPENHENKRTREEVYVDWLSRQIQRRGGATLEPEQTKLVSFQRTRSVRHLRDRHSEGPDAVMRGILTITEPAAFARLLAQGIGRHRAYGYGMLLLRPART